MSMERNGQRFYATSEACEIAGISRNTFLRWVRAGLFADVEYRDRNGWRLFTENDLGRLKTEANQIQRAESGKLKQLKTNRF